VSRLHSQQTIESNKLARRLRRQVGRTLTDFNMIAEGDLIMVCVSGGKDSYTLLDLLLSMRRNAPVKFELVVVNLDQKQPGFPIDVLPNYLTDLGVKFHILSEDTYSVVTALTPAGKTTCRICSRLRRGILYRFAKQLGATKIALGHHLDDAVETLFLNMFFGSKLKSMPPKLLSDDGANMIIRPLYRCRERDIQAYSMGREHPIIPCNLCGSQPNLQRAKIKKMLQNWDLEQSDRVENIARSMENLAPSQLADAQLFDFSGLARRARTLPTIDLISR